VSSRSVVIFLDLPNGVFNFVSEGSRKSGGIGTHLPLVYVDINL
jgi:hypothetical protein